MSGVDYAIAPAQPAHADVMASLIYSSGQASLDAVFNLSSVLNAKAYIASAFILNDGHFSHRHHLVALHEENIIGCACFWPDLYGKDMQQATLASLLTFFGVDGISSVLSRAQELSSLIPKPQSNALPIGHIAVVDGYRRRGVAQALLNALYEQARRLGRQMLELDVEADNNGAIALYLAAGYKIVGRHVPTSTGQKMGLQPHLHMCKSVEVDHLS